MDEEVDDPFAGAARSSLASYLGHHGINVDDDPYAHSLLLCHAFILITFTSSTITGDLSQVDRLWSILPTMYAWLCAIDARTYLMACLSTCWSMRLTYNFYRRGGYGRFPRLWMGGEEDYRWGVLRSGMLGGRYWTLLTNDRIMMLFNLVFISSMQNYLLLYIASPSLYAYSMATSTTGTTSALNVVDYVASALFVLSLLGETISDNQQRAFQDGKRAWLGRKRGDTKGMYATVTKPTSVSYYSSIEREYEDGFCECSYFLQTARSLECRGNGDMKGTRSPPTTITLSHALLFFVPPRREKKKVNRVYSQSFASPRTHSSSCCGYRTVSFRWRRPSMATALAYHRRHRVIVT